MDRELPLINFVIINEWINRFVIKSMNVISHRIYISNGIIVIWCVQWSSNRNNFIKCSSDFCCVLFSVVSFFLALASQTFSLSTSSTFALFGEKYHHNSGSQFIKFDQKIGLVAYAANSMFALLFKMLQPITDANANITVAVECRHRCDNICEY